MSAEAMRKILFHLEVDVPDDVPEFTEAVQFFNELHDELAPLVKEGEGKGYRFLIKVEPFMSLISPIPNPGGRK